MLNAYETMYILSPRLEEAAIDALVEKFNQLISKEGGQVEKTDKMGRRRMAYEVQGMKEGFYILTNFKAPSKLIAELERQFKITDEVVRHIVIRQGK